MPPPPTPESAERTLALHLGPRQLSDELERRGLRASGFGGEDSRRLQQELDLEYAAEQAARAELRAAHEERCRIDAEEAQRAR